MKKYLMTGVAALAFAATLTSCSKAGDLYDEGRIEKEKEVATKKDFASQFEAKFGTPDKNHNWGFDNVPVADLNATAKTRGVNVNGNEWEYQPGAITQDELDAVKAFFDLPHENYTNPPVHFTDFWVQQVYRSQQHYWDGFNQELEGSAHMNKLACKKADGTWEHSNNFNAANNFDWGGCTLMVQSGTESFAFSNSRDGGKDYETYIIKEINGNYYVGFDFYANGTNGNEQVARNYIFNDWIVKIVPATLTSAKMIIAEDLSANNGSDFDYNDVVFTVAFSAKQVATDSYHNHQFAHITLLAAGGTMPLYIGGKANGVEVHEAFGVSTSTMVNTNNGTVSKAPVQFVLDMGSIGWSDTPTANPKDVEVYVEGKTNLTLGTEIGQPSEKLCVDQNFQWCDEREPIETKYTRFPDWVKNRSVKWY